jgi:hypothetical protein
VENITPQVSAWDGHTYMWSGLCDGLRSSSSGEGLVLLAVLSVLLPMEPSLVPLHGGNWSPCNLRLTLEQTGAVPRS